jgi:hypothetical protein
MLRVEVFYDNGSSELLEWKDTTRLAFFGNDISNEYLRLVLGVTHIEILSYQPFN